MSNIIRFDPVGTIEGFEESEYGKYVFASDYDEAQSQLAALREELAKAKRNEHNSEVAYKAAIEKQEELREELGQCKGEYDRAVNRVSNSEQRLADAERRNSELEWLLRDIYNQNELSAFDDQRIDAALNPKPEASSHDE